MGKVTRTVLGNALASTLSTAMTTTIPDSGGQFAVAAATGWPTTNFVVVVDRGNNEEKILCASRTGTTATVAAGGRGFDQTLIQKHDAGVPVEPEIDAAMLTALLEHVNTDVDSDHSAYELTADVGLVADMVALIPGNTGSSGTVGGGGGGGPG